jgi:hypothetical protein
MNIGKAIFFGLSLIALAIFATDAMRPANAGLMDGEFVNPGRGDMAQAWIIDTSTGEYRLCDRNGKCREWNSSQ